MAARDKSQPSRTDWPWDGTRSDRSEPEIINSQYGPGGANVPSCGHLTRTVSEPRPRISRPTYRWSMSFVCVTEHDLINATDPIWAASSVRIVSSSPYD